MMLSRNTSIFLAGHQGMVGSAVHRLLQREGFADVRTTASRELDLRDHDAVDRYLGSTSPDAVILCAARVGGIQANLDSPATFLLDNLQIQNSVIAASHRHGVKRFVFLGSSCIYPRNCPQPMQEEQLLTGALEPTNEGYALAKIAGLKLLEAMHRQHGFNSISLMPCNLYGPNDSFDLQKSHVLSALVRRFVDAKAGGVPSLTLWGTGVARREFMHVDDLASAILFMMERHEHQPCINIGTGEDLSIRELAQRIATQVGYAGQIQWDASRPDGMLRKCMDVSRMHAFGFVPTISLQTGLNQMIDLYTHARSHT